jgi:hypothetical protein
VIGTHGGVGSTIAGASCDPIRLSGERQVLVDGSRVLSQGGVDDHENRQRCVVAESLEVASPGCEDGGRFVFGDPDTPAEHE